MDANVPPEVWHMPIRQLAIDPFFLCGSDRIPQTTRAVDGSRRDTNLVICWARASHEFSRTIFGSTGVVRANTAASRTRRGNSLSGPVKTRGLPVRGMMSGVATVHSPAAKWS
jgi:hypothetical protein